MKWIIFLAIGILTHLFWMATGNPFPAALWNVAWLVLLAKGIVVLGRRIAK